MFRAARTKDIVAAIGWFLLAAGISWIVVTYVRNPSFFASKVETGDWHQLLGEPASSRVLIYSLSTCPACQETKALLDRHCVECHRPGATNALAAKLDLTPAHAWQSLHAARWLSTCVMVAPARLP